MVPFLTELRELMDWCVASTTLDLILWLKVQDVWYEMFLVKCRRKREEVGLFVVVGFSLANEMVVSCLLEKPSNIRRPTTTNNQVHPWLTVDHSSSYHSVVSTVVDLTTQFVICTQPSD